MAAPDSAAAPDAAAGKTKLTLRLDRGVIARAKAYAARRGASVSELVEDYFRLVAASDLEPRGADSPGALVDWREALGPRVRALVNRPEPAHPVSEDDYGRYLMEKHLGSEHDRGGAA